MPPRPRSPRRRRPPWRAAGSWLEPQRQIAHEARIVVLGQPRCLGGDRAQQVGQRLDQIGRAHAELQSLMRISYAVFCLKKKKKNQKNTDNNKTQQPTTP